jgi:NADH dehydrogenase
VILLTGGTGFVGVHVAHALRAQSRDVRCLVREPSRAEKLTAWGCELARGDVTDPEALKRAVAGCDVVVHLVAIIAGSRSDFDRVMTQGTQNLVAAAQEARVRRFVLMSALGVGEETKDLTPYYHAKWDMELAVKESGLEHVIFRPSFVFGRDGGVLPLFVRQVRWSPLTPVLGNGETRLQPIWVDDVASYFAKAVDLEGAQDRIFELGGPDAVSWNEFWVRLKRVLGQRRPSFHVPIGLMRLNALVTERLPGNVPLTRDLLKMLEAGDNVVTNTDAVETFQLPLVPLDEQLRRAT